MTASAVVEGVALPANGVTEVATDFSAVVTALRQAGGDQYDPVHLLYLEVLARRVPTQPASVQHILGRKLTLALLDFKQGLELAHAKAQASSQISLASQQQGAGLADLVHQLAQAAPDQAPQHPGQPAAAPFEPQAGPQRELKTLRHFRSTWSKLSVDKQLAQALKQAPKQAGPINSHQLVLRSLAHMRDTSPDYLNRFMSYADTLLHLDQSAGKGLVAPKRATDGTTMPKKVANRQRTR